MRCGARQVRVYGRPMRQTPSVWAGPALHICMVGCTRIYAWYHFSFGIKKSFIYVRNVQCWYKQRERPRGDSILCIYLYNESCVCVCGPSCAWERRSSDCTGPPVHYDRDLLVQNTRGRNSSSGLFLKQARCVGESMQALSVAYYTPKRVPGGVQ